MGRILIAVLVAAFLALVILVWLVPSLGVFLGLLLVLCLLMVISTYLVMGRQGFHPLRLLKSDTVPPLGPTAVMVRGEAMVGLLYIPFVKLTFDESWASVSTGPTPVGIRRTAVTTVRMVGVPGFHGIHFGTEDGRYDGVVFFTFSRTGFGARRVLDALGNCGWPVKGHLQPHD